MPSVHNEHFRETGRGLPARGADRTRDSAAAAPHAGWAREWARGAGVDTALLIGSAAAGDGAGGAASGDVDLLCRVERVDRALFDRLVGTVAAAAPGRAVRVETRIGPVGPAGGSGLVVHLLLHDARSWARTSPVSRCLAEGLGTRIWGPPGAADPFAAPGPPGMIAGWLRRDLDRLASALARRAAPVRRWRFDGAARLARSWVPAATPAAHAKLCRHVAAMLRGWALLLPGWAGPARAAEAAELARIAAALAAGETAAPAAALDALRVREAR